MLRVVVAVPPEHQFFQNEEDHDAEQHRGGHPVRIAMLERMRQDFQKGSAKQRANGVGNQDVDTLGSD